MRLKLPTPKVPERRWTIRNWDPQPKPTLTPREQQVFALVGRAFSNLQISAALGISPDTVHNHVSSIFKKLGVHDRLNLLIYATRGVPRDTSNLGKGQSC